MRAYDIIQKKKTGRELSTREIAFLIEGFLTGGVPDYQMAAFAMAVFFQGMTTTETAELTMAMVNSGEKVDLSAVLGKKVDKHSTGGVGDKTTLVVGPLVAAAGVPVAKMSGRGLGHTGGTIDKLESIPGFSTVLTKEKFIASVNTIKIAISGQTGNLAPADKKLYALRDVTATVDSIPLIASSVMSKKIAAGADAIVLDVKTGSGAFMKTFDESVALARAMVEIGTKVGRETVALVTDMEQPLGRAVGNVLEVIEAVECLQGRGPEDLEELSLTLGSQMICLAGKAENPERAKDLLREILREGKGLQKFKELVSNQGGDVHSLDDYNLLPKAGSTITVNAPEDGYVSAIQAEEIGLAAMTLGAGRETKDSQIDPAVGIKLVKKVGETAVRGEPVAVLFVNDPQKGAQAQKKVADAYTISRKQPAPRKLIQGQVIPG